MTAARSSGEDDHTGHYSSQHDADEGHRDYGIGKLGHRATPAHPLLRCPIVYIPTWDNARGFSIIGVAMGNADYREHYDAFLQKLREARQDAGLTQEEVARRLGKPQSFVSKCESGERRVDAVELTRFAKLYQRDISFFLPSKNN